MRVKALLLLFALFSVLYVNAASAGEMEEWFDSEWRVAQIRYEDGEMRDLLPNTKILATFSETGRVAGSAGCNRFFANFSVNGNNIKIGSAATTKMFCASPMGIMEQESVFLRTLEKAAQFRFNCGQLELLDSEGKTTLIFAKADSEIFEQSLTGIWYIDSMGGKKPITGTMITMIFTEDGKISGRATINNYFASWVKSDGLILFSHAASTMMAGPEQQMKQESEFFRMLDRVRKYKIRDGQLILTTAEGEQIVALRVEM